MFGKNAICFTGHRTLNKQYLNMSSRTAEWDLLYQSIMNFCQRAYNKGWKTFLVGGALGVDMLAGLVIVEMMTRHACDDIKLHLCIPHKDYNRKWYKQSHDELAYLKSYATTHVLHQDAMPFAIRMLFARNHFMVDNSMLTCAIYDGRVGTNGKGVGGTFECLSYARNHRDKKVVCVMNPLETNELGFCKEVWNTP